MTTTTSRDLSRKFGEVKGTLLSVNPCTKFKSHGAKYTLAVIAPSKGGRRDDPFEVFPGTCVPYCREESSRSVEM